MYTFDIKNAKRYEKEDAEKNIQNIVYINQKEIIIFIQPQLVKIQILFVKRLHKLKIIWYNKNRNLKKVHWIYETNVYQKDTKKIYINNLEQFWSNRFNTKPQNPTKINKVQQSQKMAKINR